MTVLLASNRHPDSVLLDRALAEPACPVDDAVRVRSDALLTQVASTLDPDLVIMGVDGERGTGDVREVVEDSIPPSVPLILLVDAEKGDDEIRSQAAGVVTREDPSVEPLAHAIVDVLGDGGYGDTAEELCQGERVTRTTLLREVFEKAPAMVATFRGPEHVCEMANPQYLSLVGDRDIVGRPIREALPEAAGQGYFELMDRAYREGTPVGGREQPLEIRTSSGDDLESRYVDFVYQPLREDGDVVGLVAHGVDVTDQVESRRRVEESERRLRQILGTTADGILLMDRDGEIRYANAAALRLVGFDRDDLVGMDCEDSRWEVRTLGGEPIPAEERAVPRALATGETVQSVPYVLGGEGDVVVSVNAAPMRNDDGEVVGAVASLRDVTDRERVQAELDKTTRLLDSVVESVPDAIYAKDRAGRYLMINSGGAGLFGMTVDQVIGETDDRLFTEEDAARIRDDDLRVMESGESVHFREQARSHDGESRYFDVTKSPLHGAEGEVVGVVGISRDITDRVRARRALERSEEKYEKLFQTTPMGIALSTLDGGELLEVNEGFEALLGHTREKLIGSTALELGIWVEEKDRDRLVRAIRTEGRARGLDVKLRRRNGEVIEAEMFGEAIEIEGRRCILTVTRDVTEQREHQRELSRSKEKIEQYAAHITSSREQERKQLARDIHDELGQLLTAVRMKVGRLAKVSDAEGWVDPGEFEEIGELLERGVKEVRDLSTSLRPSTLDQFGLLDAIRWQAERAADSFDFDISVDSDVRDVSLPGDREIHVFRVVQEALTNVGRHADAEHGRVEIRESDGSLLVRVLDDGRGVEFKELASSDSHGVLGMEERAHVLGGELSLSNRPEGGAEVRLEIPYQGRQP